MTAHEPILRKTGRRTVEVLLWCGAGLGILSILSALAVVTFGIVPLVVASGSMSPEITTGSLGLARTTPASELQLGDVVSVTGVDGTRVTHRIVATEQQSDLVVLTLQGDTNPSPDQESYRVKEADRVFFSVPHIGRVIMALTSPWGMFLSGLVAATLLFSAFRRRPPVDADAEAGEVTQAAAAPAAPLGGHRLARVRVRAIATVLAVSIPALLLVTANSGTAAFFTDDGTVTTTGFAAHKVRQPGPLTCTASSNTITVTTTPLVVGDPPRTDYTYWATVYDQNGVVYRAQTQMTGNPASPVSATFTIDATVPSAGTTYWIRVSSKVGGSGWVSDEFRRQPFGRAAESLRCGEASPPVLVFTQPTNGFNGTPAQIQAICGTTGDPAACGTVTPAGNKTVVSVEYILRRRSWLGTSCWDGSGWVIVGGCGYRPATTNLNGATTNWSVSGGGNNLYTTTFGPHTYTLTVKAKDSVGYIAESSISYKRSS